MKVKLTKDGLVKYQDKPAFVEMLKKEGWIVVDDESITAEVTHVVRRGRPRVTGNDHSA